MKHVLMTVLAAIVMIAGTAGDAEAARLGGGRSFGMSRNMAPKAPAAAPAPQQPAQVAPQPGAPAAVPAAPPPRPATRSWLGPLAGVAAGLGLAALASHFGLGDELGGLVLGVLVIAALAFVMRRVFAGRASAPQYAGGIGSGGATGGTDARRNYSGGGTAVAAAAGLAGDVPDDFDAAGFERQAKLNFIRLQAANDRGDLEDIREFVGPEVFAEIKLQLEERGGKPQQTDVVHLDARLLDLATDGARQIASVRFSGSLRETREGSVSGFAEIWHLVRPTDGRSGWIVAGIEQA